jgi:hypothetical protein
MVGFHFPAMIAMAVVTGHSEIFSMTISDMGTYLFVSHCQDVGQQDIGRNSLAGEAACGAALGLL